jgi:hypothetical protein
LLFVPVKGISEFSSIDSLRGFPYGILNAGDIEGSLSPNLKLSSHEISIKHIPDSFEFKALLSGSAIHKLLLLLLTALQSILKFLIFIHQVLSKGNQFDHDLLVNAFLPPEESGR